MTLFGFGITRQLIPNKYWIGGQKYHIGLELIHSSGFLLEWKDVSVDWVPLKDLKQSNPVYMAVYAVVNEISDDTDFN